jgi:hypothetical protein
MKRKDKPSEETIVNEEFGQSEDWKKTTPSHMDFLFEYNNIKIRGMKDSDKPKPVMITPYSNIKIARRPSTSEAIV